MVKELPNAQDVSRIRPSKMVPVTVTMASSPTVQTMALSAVLAILYAILAVVPTVITVSLAQLTRHSSLQDVSHAMLTARIAMVKPPTDAQIVLIMLNSLSLVMVMSVLARLVSGQQPPLHSTASHTSVMLAASPATDHIPITATLAMMDSNS